MPRPKTNPTSAEIDDEIIRLMREQEERLAALKERRRQAEMTEHLRRGQLLCSYLNGPHGADIRRVLAPVVSRRDRTLFGLGDEDALRDRASDEGPPNERRSPTDPPATTAT